MWQLEGNRAVLVGYRIFAAPGEPEPRLPGFTPRCCYRIEILLVLAFLVYLTGISIDKACEVMRFFCRLPLSKSQADALLRQLGRHWEEEFDTLCLLLAQASVVYMDETGWKIGSDGCSLWTFASEATRVFLFGCRKDEKTLNAVLPLDVFTGVGVSDNAAVYGDRFVRAQKCWAHLLRKAIKLALLYPKKRKYRAFADGLLQLFRDAKKIAADKRLKEAGRQKRKDQLDNRLCELCHRHMRDLAADAPPHERDFANLAFELIGLMSGEELFTFVLDPSVEPTNNLPEREHRPAATDRNTGRTSKAPPGAKRRSVIVSVLGSLQAVLPDFHLDSLLSEIGTWMRDGISRFRRKLESLGLKLPSLAERAAHWQAIGIPMLTPLPDTS